MKKLRIITLFIITLTLLVSSIVGYNFLNNFYAVIPHQVYRTRELSKKQFERTIKKYHIQSVINLRGKHPEKLWYQQEIAATNAMHVTHYDVRLSSYKLPKPKTLSLLINVLARAEKPILIHCNSGVDRTGLASMIALILHGNSTLSSIENQISWHYFAIRSDSVGKLIFKQYSKWLSVNHLKHNKKHFLDWVNVTART